MRSPRLLLCLLGTLLLGCQSSESRPADPEQGVDASEAEELVPEADLRLNSELTVELPELLDLDVDDDPEALDLSELEDQEPELPPELDALEILDEELAPELGDSKVEDAAETLEPPPGLQLGSWETQPTSKRKPKAPRSSSWAVALTSMPPSPGGHRCSMAATWWSCAPLARKGRHSRYASGKAGSVPLS
jgi:hypothetical protein